MSEMYYLYFKAIQQGIDKRNSAQEFQVFQKGLTLPMLRLYSSKAQGYKDFWKPSRPCHVGIHLIALAENSQMRTHVPGFPSFFNFFHIIFY